MNTNYLEVNETLFNQKFLINSPLTTGGGIDDDDDSGSESGLGWLKPIGTLPGVPGGRGGGGGGGDHGGTIPIITPSQRQEASQCKFIIPKEGSCVKTKDINSSKKYFINLCTSDDVPEPQLYYTDEELQRILSSGSEGQIDNIRIPISIGEKNVATDNANEPCFNVDVIMNTQFYETKFLQSEIYREFFIVVSIEGVELKHKVQLDKDGFKLLKHKKSMGKLVPQFVRSKAGIHEISTHGGSGEARIVSSGALPFPKKTATTPTNANGSSADQLLLEPVQTRRFVHEIIGTKDDEGGTGLSCVLTQYSEELATAKIKIPNLLNPKKLTVTIGADRLLVDCPVGSLDLFFPLDFHQEKCRAEYDPSEGVLTIHLPLIVKP